MEKEPQPESMATVTIKPDYAPSEYSSEPPPAYPRIQSSAVQVAKIVAVTVVLVSFVLGSFLLASAYITANASCRQLEQELELLSEAADRFQQPPLQPEALVQEESSPKKEQAEPLQADDNKVADSNTNEASTSSSSSDSSSSESSDESNERIHFKLPLQLDFDDLAGALIEKNQKSRMNCVVEKKRAEEIVDHQPKTVRLPFGLNLTTDPRYERISGERMAIFCESGNMQQNRNQQENNNNDNDDEDNSEEGDSDEDAVMIQPVMIPIAQAQFQTHMPQQMRPVQQMEVQPPNAFPPTAILHQIAQQIIAQKIMEAQRARAQQQQIQENTIQNEQQQQPRFPIPLPEEILTQLNRLPNRDVIVAVSEQEPEEISQEQDNSSNGQEANEVRISPQPLRVIPQPMVQAQMQVMQQPRTNPIEMNGRQNYARAMPVHIPVHMINTQQEPQQQQVEPQAAASENLRPHYVHPRSVRSVPEAFAPKSQKRVKRCSCDCAC